jgi:hypothetical protein
MQKEKAKSRRHVCSHPITKQRGKN